MTKKEAISAIHAQFANDLTKKQVGELFDALFDAAGGALKSEGRQGMMLPIESRDFAAVIDFENVEDGQYLLQADLVYGDRDSEAGLQSVQINRPIVVWEENGKKNAAWDTTGAATNIQQTPGSVSW